ncbi:ParB/RepB/Spo0J family partition protein [uncultured Hoeflea sp.]|uniref:ParB/RepB/Spo0J family partition protein n=1 Tax=uncultured Hoeflea sp. TaxID=538666 RepID=UPI0026277FDB|nr:ParB/RepB/Spo0J family partition protein [uncultured Hoeflea sp.]
MELKHIELTNLSPAKTNVRKQGSKDCDDLIPSIRSLGIIQPLLVRPNGSPTSFEIVAGQRRYHALSKIAEDENIDPVPCIVMSESDDAQAIEASLAENIARLPMDEIDQYKAFAALTKQGKSIGDIASMFGVSERLVKQRLAIANLIAPILNAYRKGDIRAETVRLLTMATRQQQKDWYAMVKAGDCYPPTGRALKIWLFGGAEIATTHALFDLADYTGNIVSDLFGEEAYFDDIDQFWTLQNAAISALKSRYAEDGWKDVIVQEVGERWCSWEMTKRAKSKGGKVYIEIGHNGAVEVYEGYVTSAEARRLEKAGNADAESAVADIKPELTKAAQNYVDLHRHSAVRRDLLNHQGLALRFCVAQIIAGSDLWKVQADPRKASKPEIADSLATNKAEAAFEAERNEIRMLLGLETLTDSEADNELGEDEKDDCQSATLVPRRDDWEHEHDGHGILSKLKTLDDETVMRILTFITAECLPSGTAWVDALGKTMETDMQTCWSPDQAFLDLIRDKTVLNAVVGHVAGKDTAEAHVTSPCKVQRQILTNCIKGERKTEENAWALPHMAFPMRGFGDQNGLSAVARWDAVKHHYEQ